MIWYEWNFSYRASITWFNYQHGLTGAHFGMQIKSLLIAACLVVRLLAEIK